jgi:hypothetical protein
MQGCVEEEDDQGSSCARRNTAGSSSRETGSRARPNVGQPLRFRLDSIDFFFLAARIWLFLYGHAAAVGLERKLVRTMVLNSD